MVCALHQGSTGRRPDSLPIFWPRLEESGVFHKHWQWLWLVPLALWWFQLFPDKSKKKKTQVNDLCRCIISFSGKAETCVESPGTFASLVVEVTCLLSVLSVPSASSPGDSPGEALVFFRSRLDLHWISVSRPASSGGIIVMRTRYLSSHFKPLWNNITTYTSMQIGFSFVYIFYWMAWENLWIYLGLLIFFNSIILSIIIQCCRHD